AGNEQEHEVVIRGDYRVVVVGRSETSDVYVPGTDTRLRLDVTLAPAARAAAVDGLARADDGTLVLVWSGFAEARDAHDHPEATRASLLAAAQDHSGGVMVAIPGPPPATADGLEQDDGEPAGEFHMTLAFLGTTDELNADLRPALDAAVRLCA